MPIIRTQLRRNSTGAAVASLHAELHKIGGAIEEDEKTNKKFGQSTEVLVLNFRKRHGLPSVAAGGNLFDEAAARVLNVATAFADGERDALRAALRESVAETLPTAHVREIKAHLRYALLAGDYGIARTLARRIPGGVVSGEDMIPDYDDLPVGYRTPDLPHPENYYAYKQEIVGNTKLVQMLNALPGLTKESFAKDGFEQPRNATDIDESALGRAKKAGTYVLNALRDWQTGNQQFTRREYQQALNSYEKSLEAVADYLDPQSVQGQTVEQRLANVIQRIAREDPPIYAWFWNQIRSRRSITALSNLYASDRESLNGDDQALGTWKKITIPTDDRCPRTKCCFIASVSSILLTSTCLGVSLRYSYFFPSPLINASRFLATFFYEHSDLVDPTPQRRVTRVDPLMIMLATLWIPMAKAEAFRQKRQYDLAQAAIGNLLEENEQAPPSFRLINEFIELPFLRILKAEILTAKGDALYKMRAHAAARVEYTRAINVFGGSAYGRRVQNAAADLTTGLNALLQSHNVSVPRNAGKKDLIKIQRRLFASDAKRKAALQAFGKDLTLPERERSNALRRTIKPLSGVQVFTGFSWDTEPHQLLFTFVPDAEANLNPKVYAVLLTAQARLKQLEAGLNFLGYRDNYIPPWRFQLLLERARYFAEHAKNVQRDYLNFLNNAENEELREAGAAQVVEQEKSNIRVEAARVEQAGAAIAVSRASVEMSNLVAANSQIRFDQYAVFDRFATEKELEKSLWDIASGIGEMFVGVATGNLVLAFQGGKDFLGAAITGGGSVESLQRDFELINLGLAMTEAEASSAISAAQLEVTKKEAVVAGLLHQAALMRHEHAIQNLEYTRSRTLTAELWFRLAVAIREVSEKYLQYAIHLAFLAEQAYEFEADKQLNVIRFDYDQSDVGDFLAADFLLRDLDTLEHDLIVSQRERQQQVRYVLSMAREFPEALQELRDNGTVTFSMVLEQIERRFPGLYNARLGAVDILPIALMDSTRFSLELRHLGSGQTRTRPQPIPDTEPEAVRTLETHWPRQIRVYGPETAIFSGLSRQEASAVFPFATNGQRNAFEGRPAAGAWSIDMSMRENQVVPGTLADVLITFMISGYYDADLRQLQEALPARPNVPTKFLSARNHFPDAFYEFNRTGKMTWNVTQDFLTLTEKAGRLRNLGFLLLPAPGGANAGRFHCRRELKFRIKSDLALEMIGENPKVTITTTAPNTITVSATGAQARGAVWDFGDGRGRAEGLTASYVYDKPGKYIVTFRSVLQGRLSEFSTEVDVSRAHQMSAPFIARAELSKVAGAPAGQARIKASTGTEASVMWQLNGGETQRGREVHFDLPPGDYTLRFLAVRPLRARVSSHQRDAGPTPTKLDLSSLTLTTNRRFDAAGNGVTLPADYSPLAKYLFGENGERVLSAADHWTLEVNVADNPFLETVSNADVRHLDFSSLQDVLLTMEYEVG